MGALFADDVAECGLPHQFTRPLVLLARTRPRMQVRRPVADGFPSQSHDREAQEAQTSVRSRVTFERVTGAAADRRPRGGGAAVCSVAAVQGSAGADVGLRRPAWTAARAFPARLGRLEPGHDERGSDSASSCADRYPPQTLVKRCRGPLGCATLTTRCPQPNVGNDAQVGLPPNGCVPRFKSWPGFRGGAIGSETQLPRPIISRRLQPTLAANFRCGSGRHRATRDSGTVAAWGPVIEEALNLPLAGARCWAAAHVRRLSDAAFRKNPADRAGEHQTWTWDGSGWEPRQRRGPNRWIRASDCSTACRDDRI